MGNQGRRIRNAVGEAVLKRWSGKDPGMGWKGRGQEAGCFWSRGDVCLDLFLKESQLEGKWGRDWEETSDRAGIEIQRGRVGGVDLYVGLSGDDE